MRSVVVIQWLQLSSEYPSFMRKEETRRAESKQPHLTATQHIYTFFTCTYIVTATSAVFEVFPYVRYAYWAIVLYTGFSSASQ
jgi:hypothetical protein